jgi:hypothetical protein
LKKIVIKMKTLCSEVIIKIMKCSVNKENTKTKEKYCEFYIKTMQNNILPNIKPKQTDHILVSQIQGLCLSHQKSLDEFPKSAIH